MCVCAKETDVCGHRVRKIQMVLAFKSEIREMVPNSKVVFIIWNGYIERCFRLKIKDQTIVNVCLGIRKKAIDLMEIYIKLPRTPFIQLVVCV